ncbi:MAG: response regulator [Nitrospirae bacterium]|nr:response regulator [Nitrospirota bacterium]
MAKTILYIEDDIRNESEDRVIGALKERGLCVEIASNGKEAIEKLSQKVYDGVILDIMLPNGDKDSAVPWTIMGLTLLRTIKGGGYEVSGTMRGVPCLVVTATVELEVIDEVISLLGDDACYYEKPASQYDIANKMMELIN